MRTIRFERDEDPSTIGLKSAVFEVLGAAVLSASDAVVPTKINNAQDMTDALKYLHNGMFSTGSDSTSVIEFYNKNKDLMKLVLNKAGMSLEYAPVDETLVNFALMLKSVGERKECWLYENDNLRSRLARHGVEKLVQHEREVIRLTQKISFMKLKNEDVTVEEQRLAALKAQLEQEMKKVDISNTSVMADMLLRNVVEKRLEGCNALYNQVIQSAGKDLRNFKLETIEAVCQLFGVDITKDSNLADNLFNRQGEYVRQFFWKVKKARKEAAESIWEKDGDNDDDDDE